MPRTFRVVPPLQRLQAKHPDAIMEDVKDRIVQTFMQRYVGDLEGLWFTFDASGKGILDASEISALTQHFLQAMKNLLVEMQQQVLGTLPLL